MSHVVLARKYRPRSFDQMVGQEHVVQALSNALSSGRLHHAYLFTGTRGIGKTTVSRILAKSLNCIGPDGGGSVTAQPCGQCQACTEIDADRYIDYIELDAASNRSIDEIRDLIERAAYKPSVGRYKVFMIDEAHQLTKDAFNALLKTLEEPPDYLKFVLATTDPEKMLPTVLSRCLQFNLRPMAPEVIQAHLARVLQAETVACDASALRLLARAARGSMRDALSLTDQAIAYGAGTITEGGVRAMLGVVDRQHAARLVGALGRRDGAEVLAVVDELRANGLSAFGTLEEMALLLQQMAVEQAVPGALDQQDAQVQQAVELAHALPADETQLLYSIVIHGRAELALLSDEYAALIMVLLRMLAFPPAVPEAPPGSRSAALKVTPTRARATAAAHPARLDASAARATPATAPPPEVPPWVTDELPDDAAIAAMGGTSGAGTSAVDAEPSLATPHPAVQRTGLNADTPMVTTPCGDRWECLIRPLAQDGSIGALVRELAWQAQPLGREDGDQVTTWRLRVERESLRSPSVRDKLEAALREAYPDERPVRLLLEPGVAEDSLALRDEAARQAAQREAERIIESDPHVRAVLQQFRTAHLVSGSIKPTQEPGIPTS
ncbi:MAG: DNA polymerase III subunit gamma/tau [Burkholderiaceae bacterium]|nr:DNA polymerase III subunit gamma/tau [Aquabacterium sp.]NUP84170.1 DNA polymerase III subunit gamma/tau [Burkholderiaceae bacterium]